MHNRYIDFYLKWTATVLLVIGCGINAMGFYPEGVIIMFVGGLFWLAVAIMWKERALIVTNGVMSAVTVLGFAANYFGLVG